MKIHLPVSSGKNDHRNDQVFDILVDISALNFSDCEFVTD